MNLIKFATWVVIFKKNPTAGLPEVSELIDSALNKRPGDQRKDSFLEKKNSIKGKMDSLWTATNITSLYHIYQEYSQIRWTSDFPVLKNTLVNDGDLKVIANKFWWKYLRPDVLSQEKLISWSMGSTNSTLSKSKKIILQNVGLLTFFKSIIFGFSSVISMQDNIFQKILTLRIK